MADTFLRELFQARNRAQNDEEQQCIICMEECGTMNSETGLAENAIRLPCEHIVGSGCIAQWLRSNNTCPLCRHVFFPTQPRPYLEHGIMVSQTDQVQTNRTGTGRDRTSSSAYNVVANHLPQIVDRHRDRAHSNRRRTTRDQIMNGPVSGITNYFLEIKLLCNRYCSELSLQLDVAHVAACVAANLVEPRPSNDVLQTHDDNCIIAVGIYVASDLTGHYRSPREIAGVIDDVSRQSIRATYDLIRDWRTVVDDDIRTQLVDIFNIQSLIWPRSRAELAAQESELESLIRVCTQYGIDLGVSDDITVLARKIATRVWTLPSLRQRRRSPRRLAATCVYMAGHLMGLPRSKASISEVTSVSVADINNIYIFLYLERRYILQKSWLRLMGKESMQGGLAMLPAVGAGVSA